MISIVLREKGKQTMHEIKTVIVELEYPTDSDNIYLITDISDEYYGVGRELIRCKECIKKPFCTIYQKTNDEHGYCSLAVRPVTCDCCKYWKGLMRDGRYWCNKHSTYMETGCKEGRRNEFNSDLP